MKRRGFLFLDALLALALTASLAAAVFPAVAQTAGASAALERRLHSEESALFACDYITDKIRHSRKRADGTAGPATSYKVAAIAADGRLRPYTFLVEEKEWKLKLYTGRKQPITGGEEPLLYEVRPLGEASYFRTESGGLVHLAYELRRHGAADHFAVETAVLPLEDYFLVGEPYA